MVQTKRAFKWITGILHKAKCKYKITGGLAARVHGATRPLYDIDIEVEDVTSLLPYIKQNHIKYGPLPYSDINWYITTLLTLNYGNQLIDLSSQKPLI